MNHFNQAGQQIEGVQQNADRIINEWKAKTIHVYQSAIHQKAQKSWRPLPSVTFVCPLSRTSWKGFYANLAAFAAECEPNRKYLSFNVMVSAEPRDKALLLRLYSPCAGIVPPIDRFQEAIRRALLVGGDEADAIKSKIRSELADFEQKWSINLLVDDLIGMPHVCVNVQVDRATSTIQVAGAFTSTDPNKYQDHCRTTSEMLSLVSVWLPAKFLTLNFDWVLSHYPLSKFTMYCMDKRAVDFSRFRVNVDDEEEWDFSYPEVDVAVIRRAGGIQK